MTTLNISCQYELEEIKVTKLSEEAQMTATVEIFEVEGDTIEITGETNFTFDAQAIGGKIYSLTVYENGVNIYELKEEDGSKGTFTLNHSYEETNYKSLEIVIVTNSGTGSLADNVGVEKLLLEKQWILFVNNNPPILESVKKVEEYIEIQWQKSEHFNFKSYHLYKSINSDSDFDLIATFDNSDSLKYLDFDNQFGDTYYYKVGIEVNSGLILYSNVLQQEFSEFMELSGIIGEACMNEDAGLVYATLQNESKLYVISTETMNIIDSANYQFDDLKHLNLSKDNQTIIAESNGTVIKINTTTLKIEKLVNATGFLGSTVIEDLYLSSFGDVFLASEDGNIIHINESFNELSVMENFHYSYYNSYNIIGDDGQFFYLHEKGLSPNSIYKANINQNYNIVGEDVHGTISSASNAYLGKNELKIYMSTGQIISTSNLSSISYIENFRNFYFSKDQQRFYTNHNPYNLSSKINVYDPDTDILLKDVYVGIYLNNLMVFKNSMAFFTSRDKNRLYYMSIK